MLKKTIVGIFLFLSYQNLLLGEETPFTLYDAQLNSNKFLERGKLKIFSQDREGLVTTLKEGKYWSIEYRLNNIRREPFIKDIKDFLLSKKGTILYQGQDYVFFKLYKNSRLYWGKVVHSRDRYSLKIVEEKSLKMAKNLILRNIHFDSGKATLKKGSEGEIKRILDFLHENSSLNVEIQGHTDSSGKAESNLRLSQRRAETIRDALIEKGVSADRLKAKGYGEAEPIADNKSVNGRRKNRRVVLKVL
jgi:outer membrane protein OmpA-like peptidoglycan-associated protein